jgi:hypothetical protein
MSQPIPAIELPSHHPSNNPPQNSSSPNSSQPHLEEHLRPITPRRQALILLSSFLTICTTIGFNQSYGVFQSYYTSSSQTLLPASTQDQSAWIAFVGTLGAGLTWGGSVVVNPLMARVKDVRVLTIVGVGCMSAGFGLASLGTEVSCEGFSLGCVTLFNPFSPSNLIRMIGDWFFYGNF